jgi:hypothetical protein
MFGAEFFIAFGIGILISGSVIAVHSFGGDIRQFFRRII